MMGLMLPGRSIAERRDIICTVPLEVMPGGGDAALPSSARHQHACSCSCSNSPLRFDASTCEGRTAAVAAPAQGRDRHIGAPASDLEHDAPCICISAQAGQRLPAGRAALSRSREPRRRRERGRLVVRRQPVARPTISMAPHLRMSAMCRMPCLGASASWKRLCRFLPGPPAHIRASARHLGQRSRGVRRS
jgi:hypothetical protein